MPRNALRLSLLAALPLTGCLGDDLEPTPTPDQDPVQAGESLTGYSMAERQRAIAAARGQDSLVALFVYQSYQDGSAACPRRETVGDTTTITGGCTTAAGDRIEGQIIGVGSTGTPSSVVFESFTVDGVTDLAIDGKIESADASKSRVHALTMTRDDIAVRSQFVDACARDGGCTIEPGGEIEVLGHAPVVPARGDTTITLTGADILRHTLADGAECGDHTIEHPLTGTTTTPRETCLWARGAAPTPDAEAALRRVSYACTDDGGVSVSVEAALAGRVTVSLPTILTWHGRFATLRPTLPVYPTAVIGDLAVGDGGLLVGSAPVLNLGCAGTENVIGWQGTVVASDGTRAETIELFSIPAVRLDR